MLRLPEQLHSAFQSAFNGHDVDGIVALYEADAVLVGGPNGWARGTDAIRERYRAVLANQPSIDVQTLTVYACGDLAMLHGKWVLHEPGAGGTQIRRQGRNAETARQQPDGRWLFVIDSPAAPED